jgi:hypothetical protein
MVNLFFVLTGSLFATNLEAQTVHNLNSNNTQGTISFRSAKNFDTEKFFNEANAIRAFEINPDLQSTKSVKIGDIVSLQLFDGKNYVSKVNNTTTNINGNFTLALKLPDYPMAFGYITTDKEGRSLFFLSIPELNQKFASRKSIDSTEEFLIEFKDDVEIKSKSDYKKIPVGTPGADDNTAESSQILLRSMNAVNCSGNSNLTGTDPVTINVLIVYTQAAALWAAANEGGIANTIAGAMAQTKAVIDNQTNGDAVNLVYSARVNYVEHSKDMDTDLDNLTGTADGFMDEVHQLRKQYNADIVSLFTVADDNGGLGWVLSNKVRGDYSSAFNVIRVQQASRTTTLIHETGHNLGMSHNAEDSSGTPLYPYAFGWHWTGNDNVEYGSVMSYIGKEVPYFSNPDETYAGIQTGTSTANNAQVFRNTKHIIAFYSEIVNILPDAPTNIVVSNATNNGATFSWNACTNAKSYFVCHPTGGGGYSYYTTSKTTYTINNTNWFPSQCTDYDIFIMAVNECGDAVSSQTITFKTKCAAGTTVTLDSQGGTGGTASVTATYGAAMPGITLPTKTGSTFQGYYDAITGGTQYYTNSGASARSWDKTGTSATLYARWTENTLSVSPASYYFSANGSTSSSIAVTSNQSWTVSDNASWLTTSITSGSNNGTFTMTAAANTSVSSRGATVTVAGGGLIRTVSITQDGIPTYIITATAGSNGSISPNGNVTVNQGGSKTFTFTPNSGYAIDQVLVDGVDNSTAKATGYYTFSNVNANHTIEVMFSSITGIEDMDLNQVKISPNPVKNKLFIKSDLPIKKVEIYSLTGTLLILKHDIIGNISVSKLLKGVYIVKVYTDKGVIVRKIVKE